MAFPSGWGRKQKITIQSSQVVGSGSHSDFPVLVSLDHLDEWTIGVRPCVGERRDFGRLLARVIAAALIVASGY